MKQRSENSADPGAPRGKRRDRVLLAFLLACLLISLLTCLAAGAASLRLLPAQVQAGGVSHLAADYGRWQPGVLELDIGRLATAVGRGSQDWQPGGPPAAPAITPTAGRPPPGQTSAADTGPPPTARPTTTPHRLPSPTPPPAPLPVRSSPTVTALPSLQPAAPPSPAPEALPLPPTVTPLPPAPAATALAAPTDAPTPTAAASTPAPPTPSATPTAHATPDPKKVNPVFECIDVNEDGTYTAHWGYDNPNAGAVFIPSDLSINFFSPAPRDRGQPTFFEPGRRVDVFTVTFEDLDLVWVLNSSAVARWNSQRCGALTPTSAPTPSAAPEGTPTPTSTASPTPPTPAP